MPRHRTQQRGKSNTGKLVSRWIQPEKGKDKPDNILDAAERHSSKRPWSQWRDDQADRTTAPVHDSGLGGGVTAFNAGPNPTLRRGAVLAAWWGIIETVGRTSRNTQTLGIPGREQRKRIQRKAGENQSVEGRQSQAKIRSRVPLTFETGGVTCRRRGGSGRVRKKEHITSVQTHSKPSKILPFM